MAEDDIERFLPLTPLSLTMLLGLADGARHGYAIMREVERQTEGRLSPGAGSLYAALQRLQDHGLIAAAPARSAAIRPTHDPATTSSRTGAARSHVPSCCGWRG